MARVRVGNAPCSWGTLEFAGIKGKQIGFDRMLDELVESGYTGTELGDWGYMPSDPAILKAEMTRRGVAMLGAFVPVALQDPACHQAGMAGALKTAGLLAAVADEPKPYLVLADSNGTVPERTRNAGRVTPEMELNPTAWASFAKGVNMVAQAVGDQTGLQTVLHHHCGGYVETPDAIAQFLELTDPQIIGLVFDTGHYLFGSGGQEVMKGLERFKSRIRYIHLKDCRLDVAERARAEKWDYFQALRYGGLLRAGPRLCELSGGPSLAENYWLRRLLAG